jgi:hypothetical protein
MAWRETAEFFTRFNEIKGLGPMYIHARLAAAAPSTATRSPSPVNGGGTGGAGPRDSENFSLRL